MKFYTKLTACFLLAGIAGTLGSCNKGKQAGPEEQDETPVVRVETVTESDVVQKGVYTASVDAQSINNISSSTPNRIKEILVDDGMMVTKGQKLVVLDDVNIVAYETQVTNAKANVNSAQANVNTAQAALTNDQANYNRALELFKIGGGTKQTVDAMQTQLIASKNTLEAAKNSLASAKSSLAAAERTLQNARENTILTAPISGVVTARNYDPGDMTGALPILTIADIKPVKVVCNISESEISRVKDGMLADVTFDTFGDTTFSGTITMVSPTINTSTRTFAIEVSVPNEDGRIRPGMFGRVTLNLGEERHVVVPDKAVVKQPGSGNQYVYVYKDGKVSYNKVELGQRIGDTYEIISGVEPGSEVVVSGQSKLANGMAVRLAK